MRNVFLSLFLIFQIANLHSQKKIIQFKSSNEYLNYIKKEFKIPSNEIFYISTENDSLNLKLEKFGIMLFVTDSKIATVQEVAEILNTQCSPKHLLPKVTEDAIQQASTPSNVEHYRELLIGRDPMRIGALVAGNVSQPVFRRRPRAAGRHLRHRHRAARHQGQGAGRARL